MCIKAGLSLGIIHREHIMIEGRHNMVLCEKKFNHSLSILWTKVFYSFFHTCHITSTALGYLTSGLHLSTSFVNALLEERLKLSTVSDLFIVGGTKVSTQIERGWGKQ